MIHQAHGVWGSQVKQHSLWQKTANISTKLCRIPTATSAQPATAFVAVSIGSRATQQQAAGLSNQHPDMITSASFCNQ
jgi:hypothetical protein